MRGRGEAEARPQTYCVDERDFGLLSWLFFVSEGGAPGPYPGSGGTRRSVGYRGNLDEGREVPGQCQD